MTHVTQRTIINNTIDPFMKQLLTILMFLALGSHIFAQQTITGTLKGKDSQPVMYANIAMLRADDSTFVRGTVSDDKGVFTIKNDTAATVLRISAMGYATLFHPVPSPAAPSSAKIDLGTIELKEGATLLNAVRIVGEKPIYAVDGEKSLYNVSEDATIQMGNASDALQNAPGVEVDVEGNVTLNGESVTVWINDRPSHLEGEALKQYIKTLPANSIDRIEVIKNPSARYGASGPVVNIVTSQRMLRNSFVSFGANGSSRPSLSPWASYVYSNEKLHISAYVSYSGTNDKNTSTNNGRMMHDSLHIARMWSDSSSSTGLRHNIWANVNGSYEFDSMNSISGWFGTYPGWGRSDDNGITTRTDYDHLTYQPTDMSYLTHSDGSSYYHGGYGGLWFTHKFDNEGHQYSISANGNWWGSGSNATDYRHYTSQTALNYDEKQKSNDFTGSGSLSFDYSLPYSKNGEVELGASLGMGNGFDYTLRDTMDSQGHYLIDVLRSDSSRAADQNAAAYATWSRRWGGFTMKLGFRMTYEQSVSKHLYAPEYDTRAHAWIPTPSIHLSYTTKDMHNFSLSYVMRSSHPSASQLSTYESYGVESFSTGNPDLDPSMTHSVDASWNKFFIKFGSVGLSSSFKANHNRFGSLDDARYVEFFGRVVSFNKPYNVGDTRRWDLSANIMFRPSGMFNVRLSGGIADGWYRLQVRPDEWIEDEMFSWNIRLRVWAKLWNKVEVFASGDYNSRGLSPWSLLSISEPRKGLNLGASADFLDRRLSLYLNVNDIFNWNSWGSSTANPYYASTSDYRWNSRSISFGLTLRFGKMELESRAQTGATENSGAPQQEP